MVNDAERDYMYAEYAEDPVARLNLGIRRRLRRCSTEIAGASSS